VFTLSDVIDGCTVYVSAVDPPPIAAPSTVASPSAAAGPSSTYLLRLRGIPWNGTHADVVEFLRGIPLDDDAIFMCVAPDGTPNGSAIVRFSHKADMDAAMKRHKEKMHHRYIEVFPAAESELIAAKAATLPPPVISPSALVLRLRGLPFTASDQDLRDFLEMEPGT